MSADAVIALERRLLDPAVRTDRGELERLLREDFREVGASGRVYDREAIVAALAEDPGVAVEMDSVTVREVGEAVLLTYRAGRSHRSSLWVRERGEWRLLHHQGTPAAFDPQADALTRLEHLLPAPRSVPPTDWGPIESDLGTRLPSDFKAFCDRWGEGAVDGSAAHIGIPGVDTVFLRDALQDRFTRAGEPPPDAWPTPGGLLEVLSTESTKWTIFWRTDGEPDAWTMVVETDDDLVQTGLRFTEYLAGALAGELPETVAPEELLPFDGGGPPGVCGHRWRRTHPDAEDDGPAEDAVSANAVMERLGDDGRGGLSMEVDLGRVLSEPADALERFLDGLGSEDRARVIRARPRRGGSKILTCATEEDLEVIARALVAWVAAEAGVPIDEEDLDIWFETWDGAEED